MSGTAAADWEREEEASSAGLSARCAAQASSAFGEASPIPKMRSLAHCISWPALGRAMHRHNAERNSARMKYEYQIHMQQIVPNVPLMKISRCV